MSHLSKATRKRAAIVAGTVAAAMAITPASWAAAPTISSFSPASGPVGSSVTIHGQNFSGNDPNVTSVTFNGTSATFSIDNAQKITATVPSGATTGPIAVTSPDGTATSSTNFTVTTVTTHDRTITLDLRRHLVARGVVTVNDGFGACASNVPVKIQRLRNGTWRTVDTTQTDTAGTYRERIRDRVG